MRECLIAIVIALAVLAGAEIRFDDQTLRAQSRAASSQLADPVAPEPDVPAILTAAMNTSATVQTVLVVGSRHQLTPAISVFTVSPHLPVIPHSTGKPRFVPLLI